MAQVTIYLPDDVAKQARQKAKRANQSLSAYIGAIVARETTVSGWPPAFVDLLEKGGADLVEPEDPPPEEIDPVG